MKELRRSGSFLNRERTERIRALTGTRNVLILTQHDPDPDALAESGSALRALL